MRIQTDRVNTLSAWLKPPGNFVWPVRVGWDGANVKTFRTKRTLRAAAALGLQRFARQGRGRREMRSCERQTLNRRLTVVVFFFCQSGITRLLRRRFDEQHVPKVAAAREPHKRWTLVVGLTAAGGYNSSPCHVYGRTAGRAHALTGRRTTGVTLAPREEYEIDKRIRTYL